MLGSKTLVLAQHILGWARETRTQCLYESTTAMLRGETSQNDQLSYPGGGLRSDNLPAHAKHHSPDSRMSLSSSETTFTHPSSTTPLLGSYTGSKPSLPPSHPGILRRTQSSPASSPPRFDSPTEDRIPAMFKSASAPNQRISRAKKGKRVHACQHQGCEKVFFINCLLASELH